MTAARTMPPGSAVPLLGAMVFLSGASALIYQLLWLRLLGLVFGVTVHAASTVFASFMAGLALGSYAAGRFAPRIRRPLLWFGVAEWGIAITALLTPYALEGLQLLYGSLHHAAPTSMTALTTARFATAFLALIVPTSLMGATLPIVMKSALARSPNTASGFGALYAANTAGAIAGALTAGLLLIPVAGIRRTFVAAAAANLVVGAMALVMGLRAQGPALPAGTDRGAAAPDPISTAARHVVLGVFALSGFTSLALEVVWFRVNVLVLRPTVYAFAIMLATVLAGIAVGSALMAPFLRRRRDWVTILAMLEFVIAIAGLSSFAALEKAPDLVARGQNVLTWLPDYLVPLVVTSLVTIFPAMVAMGAAYPVGLQLWQSGSTGADSAVRRIGTFNAVNVTGAIAGSLAAGFLMLPLLGSRATLISLSSATAAGALLLLVVSRAPLPRRALVGAAGLLALGLLPVPDPFEVFLAQRLQGYPLIWRQEGVQTTVSVHRFGQRRVMFLDGLHQASTVGPLVLGHRRIGHFGPLLHRRASDVLVIGLGGGATAGAASQYPFAHTEVIELSEAVVAGAAFFSDVNYDLLRRSNVSLRIDDGRSHLQLSGKRYDVITADIIQPVHAGAGNVYSAEYFSLVRAALREGGLAVQWVSGTDAEYRMIMRTFLSVFPHATLWADGSVMVGSVHPQRLDRSDIEWKLHVPQVRSALAEAGIRSFADLQTLYTADSSAMRAFVGPGPLLTDDRPAIEYFLSLPRTPLDLSPLRANR